MIHKNYLKDNEIVVFADTVLFSKDAVFKCIYWYGDKFHTNISIEDDTAYRISIIPTLNPSMGLDEMELYRMHTVYTLHSLR